MYQAQPHAARHLAQDLPRIDPTGRVIVARVSATDWEDSDIGSWCREMADSLRDAGSVLLMVSEGQSVWLLEQLRRCNQDLDGLAQLYRGQGGVRYLLHYWRNALGVVGTEDIELTRHTGGFVLAGRPQPLAETGGDELLFWPSDRCWKARRPSPSTGNCSIASANWVPGLVWRCPPR